MKDQKKSKKQIKPPYEMLATFTAPHGIVPDLERLHFLIGEVLDILGSPAHSLNATVRRKEEK